MLVNGAQAPYKMGVRSRRKRLYNAPHAAGQRGAAVNPLRFWGSMATGVVRYSNRRFDNFFFSGMAIFILTTVFVGFARSYYLAGVFRAPLPNLLVHIHGAVFSSWTLLLIAQTSLVAAGRVDLHPAWACWASVWRV